MDILRMIGAGVVLLAGCDTPERPPSSERTGTVPPRSHEFEVAVVMGRIQSYHGKLWASTAADNAELAAFYLHEMEEAMEEVARHALPDMGVDVAAQMRIYGLPSIERLEGKLKGEGVAALHAAHEDLVVSCNGCHIATGHPYLRITIPEGIHIPGQDFSVITPTRHPG